MIDTMSILAQFRQAAEARGLLLPDHLDTDGKLYRCPLRGGTHGKKDGAWLLHLDEVPAGGFQNFRDCLNWENWRADIGHQLTPEEEAAHRARTEAQRAAMRGGASDDGMLARFGLLVWPETGGAWKNVGRYPVGTAKDAAFQVFEDLDTLDPQVRGAEQEAPDGPPFLRFDPEALEAFTEWRTGFEAELRTEDLYPALESHLARYRKLVPALAVHLADGHHGPVGFASTLRALH